MCYIHTFDLFCELDELNLWPQEFDKNKIKVYIQITIHQEVHSLQCFKLRYYKTFLEINVKCSRSHMFFRLHSGLHMQRVLKICTLTNNYIKQFKLFVRKHCCTLTTAIINYEKHPI